MGDEGETNTRLEIFALWQKGYSEKQIVKELGTSSGAIYRVKQAYAQRNSIEPLPRGGSEPKWTEEETNCMRKFVEENRQATIDDIRDRLFCDVDHRYGRSTIFRHMKEEGATLREGCTRPAMCDSHKVKRLEYCLKNKGITVF